MRGGCNWRCGFGSEEAAATKSGGPRAGSPPLNFSNRLLTCQRLMQTKLGTVKDYYEPIVSQISWTWYLGCHVGDGRRPRHICFASKQGEKGREEEWQKRQRSTEEGRRPRIEVDRFSVPAKDSRCLRAHDAERQAFKSGLEVTRVPRCLEAYLCERHLRRTDGESGLHGRKPSAT